MNYENIAENLDDQTLGEIASTVIEDFKDDEESRQEWLDMHAHWLRLFYQNDRPLNPPWEGASDESMPILAEACVQFHSRAFKAFFPNRRIIQCIPTGSVKDQTLDRCKRVAQHMSWQLLFKDQDYKKNKDRLLLSVPLHGSCFTKTYWHPILERNVVENVRAEDLVVPYGVGPRDIEDVERKTHIIWTTVNDTKILADAGFFLEEAVRYDRKETKSTDEALDEAQGLNEPMEFGHAMILEQHRLLDLDDDGIAEPYIVWVDGQDEKVLRIAERWESDGGQPIDHKRPVEFFTHYPYIENPDGFYGLGLGHLIGRLNTAINKLLRQQIDAGTLSNVGNHSGFISKTLAANKGEQQMSLGKFVPTESGGEDISKGIYQFKFPGPSPTLPQVIELLMLRSDRLATVTEAITGQTNKVMQPTTILALVEQSQEVFSTVYERLFGAWENELSKIYRLNYLNLDEKEYFAVVENDGNILQGSVGKNDYAPDLMVKPIADPRMTTKQQKMAQAEAEYGILSQHPLVINSPPHFRAVTQRFLEAIESRNIDEVLPPVQPPPEPPRVDDPFEENMTALMPIPEMPPVHFAQDHDQHIRVHEGLLLDEQYKDRLPPDGRKALEAHVQMHVAFKYGQEEAGLEDGQGGMDQIGMDPARS